MGSMIKLILILQYTRVERVEASILVKDCEILITEFLNGYYYLMPHGPLSVFSMAVVWVTSLQLLYFSLYLERRRRKEC